MSELYTAVDLGSNSFRLLSANKSETKPYYKIVKLLKETPRISDNFSKTHIFGEVAIDRGINSLIKFLPYIKKSEKYKIAATGVFREAKNIDSFLEKIKPHDITISILSTEEEATISGLGAINELPFNTEKFLYIDIGGGSFEIAVFHNNNLNYYSSTPMGAVKSMEYFDIYNNYNNSNIKNLESFLDETLNKIYNNINYEDFPVILSGGTVSTLIMMEKQLNLYKRDEINGVKINLTLINKWIKTIQYTPIRERTTITGLESGREDIIFTGLLILKKFYEVFSINYGFNSEGGLLEGTLLTLINKEV